MERIWMIPFDVFYRGILLGLRAEGRSSFLAAGDNFHGAFRAMLEYARDNEPSVQAARMLENFDPMFGVCADADRMILHGIRDCVVALCGPACEIALFRLSHKMAAKELRGLPDSDVLLRCARHLNESLP
jgi:hypothetical protein